MHTELLRAITHQHALPVLEGDDLKADEQRRFTNLDFVNEHRDFSKITENDLEAVFLTLRTRCPKTWTRELEIRAKELNQKFMTVRNGDTSLFIDPDVKIVEAKTNESEVRRLMTDPESWSMDTREQACEFSEVLRHFTIFAPFEGRPFVRAWLQAIIPCFSRWILLSDSNETKVIGTLKNFLGAFGQPGIVVCLPDKGATILEILKNSARSVEALGRGTVERHYWKRLAESACGGEPGWRVLAGLKDKPLKLSQLDCLPQDWLSDANDWCEIFANLVSPEISSRFETMIMDIFKDHKGCTVHAGPPKTLARCLAKSHEYMSEFVNKQNLPRLAKFADKFQSVYKRLPSKPEDFIWNVVDLARCSITVSDAGDVIDVKRIIEENFAVICVKNSYNSQVPVKGSGYRDLKLLIEVDFNELQLGGVPRVQHKTKFICEIQILCHAWLKNKKSTSISYKILRAQSLRDLFCDAAKYVRRADTSVQAKYKDITEILKNGWLNFAKPVDFSNVQADGLLLTAAEKGWSVAGVSMLIKDLKANRDKRGMNVRTPLNLACSYGRDDVAKCLIKLGSNIEHKDSFGLTALIRAAIEGNEGCVRILLSAGACVSVKDREVKSALDHALDKFHSEGMPEYERIVNLLNGSTVIPALETGNDYPKLEELQKAAIEGSLTQFLDVQDVPHALISEFLSTQSAVNNLENLLQTLWFGGEIVRRNNIRTPLHYAAINGTRATITVLLQAGAAVNTRNSFGWTPLGYAAQYGTPEMLRVLLQACASVNAVDNTRWSPLHIAIRYGSQENVSLLLDAKSDVKAKTAAGKSPLYLALKFGNAVMVSDLLKFGANINEEYGYYELAKRNKRDRENVMIVLAEHRKVWTLFALKLYQESVGITRLLYHMMMPNYRH